MRVKIRVPEWVLEEDQRILRVGEEILSWLTFHETGSPNALGPVEMVRGVARPLPSWPGAVLGRHPTRIDVEGGALYWDAPESVEGEIKVPGTVETNNIDAPDGFPETLCVVRHLWMEWQELTHQGGSTWASTSGARRHDEVEATHLPAHSGESWGTTRITQWAGVLVDAELQGLRG